MDISKRMLMNARLVPKCGVVADIGCDHAKLPIYLIREGIADRAIAMDIAEGPLERATVNIRAAGLTDRIELRLSDGAGRLKTDESGRPEADVILMAGIGGMLAIDIVHKDIDIFRAVDCFIIQAQSNLDVLRMSMYETGFIIIDEDMEYEDGKYYTAMKLTDVSHLSGLNELPYITELKEKPDMRESIFGPAMTRKRGEIFISFLRHEAEVCDRILEGMRDKDTEAYERISTRARMAKELLLSGT